MNKNPIPYEFRLSVFYAFVEFNDKTIRWNIVKNIIDKKITNMKKIYRNESTYIEIELSKNDASVFSSNVSSEPHLMP